MRRKNPDAENKPGYKKTKVGWITKKVKHEDDFNKFSGFWDPIIPNIGHADAKTMPDQPRLVWDDERLVNSTVNNLSGDRPDQIVVFAFS